ncbi:MAG: DUF1232 domain-containing protein [Anaerolineaceae bacterium]|nr:DUF1232 domain-containing protein [Anaerolineaceae bacterium]
MTQEIPPLEKVKNGPTGFVKAISEPLSKHGWPVWLVYILAFIGVIYLLNPTAGILELIPDNIPGIGNLDESLAVLLIIAGIVEATEGKKYRADKKNANRI